MMLNEQAVRNNEFCFLENSIAKENYIYLFTSPVDEMVAYDDNHISSLFKKITENQKKGLYAVGYFSYESSISKYNINHTSSKGPIAHFVFYKFKTRLTSTEIKAVFSMIKQYGNKDESIVHDLSFNLSYKDYVDGFDKIQQHLLNGDSYQVNYTGQYAFKLQGSSFDLYEKLRAQQLVAYGAYLPFSSGHILSFSPELFFTKFGDNIKTRPMKGTIYRYADKNKDERQKQVLRSDIKNQSENLIIVDLLRNDLSRIAQTGSVKVNRLFDIETYKSVHQMTSEVEAKIDQSLSIEAIFQALFPCGSITGAPKKKTMEIIGQTEKTARGVYTGCIGYISPNSDMSFNVAIRTIQLNQHKEGVLGVGGGITARSICLNEWQEMHLKGEFFHRAPKNFKLIETLLFNCDYVLFEQHIERLSNSCQCLGFIFNINIVRDALINLSKTFKSDVEYKVRLICDHLGQYELTYEAIDYYKGIKNLSVVFSKYTMNSKNVLLQHKTTSANVRGLYNLEYQLAVKKGFHDVLFQNERGQITETSRYNLIYKVNDVLFTPPATDGLLPGIYRKQLIDNKQLIEKSINISQLIDMEEVFICNSVRGMIPVNIVLEK